MTPEQWQQVKELFHDAAVLAPEARNAFLQRQCGNDASMLGELQLLLKAHDEAEQFIEQPALVSASEILSTSEKDSWTNRRVGHYRVLREIGRGGMGLVLLAIRADDQFKKRVAIKLIKRGMDTEDILRRFRNERQILASLEHPHIARLLDGGMTEDGLPYLVMEYIEGEPLDKYADEHRLSISQRLQLFRTVCAAVQHAHQNLVVHRDLKPSNILITTEGEPKLLDFGIAKLLNPELTAQSIAPTATFIRLMTPEYASPEQIRGKSITTVSDVYSLGVLLYRLLTGHAPYHFTSHSPQEIERLVCETEPEKPSTAISRIEEIVTDNGATKTTPEAVGEARHEQPDALRRRLRGDLDNIVLKALRKEPERRYASAAQLSEDISRYMNGLPVSARKDTFAYRTSKFIGRNKVGVAAAAVVLLAILIGLTASIWQARVARRERDKAEATNGFLQAMLSASSPTSTLRKSKSDVTVRDILDEASRRLAAADLSGQPEVKAELQRIIGISYESLGQYDLAGQNLTSALEAQTKIYGEDSLETLKTSVVLAQLWATKGDYAKADNFYQQSIPILRAEQKKGTIHADYLMAALYEFALTRRVQGNSKQAEVLLRESLALSPQASPDQKNVLGVTEAVLALTLADQGKFDEAGKMIRAKLALIRQQPGEDVSGLSLCTNLTILGGILMEKGEYAEAEENLREAEAIYRKVFDPSYMPLGDNLRIQAQVLYAEHNYAEAEAKINEALEIYRKSSGRGYINYPTALIVQGSIYSQTNRTTEAEKMLREAVGIRSEYMPEAHFLRAVANGALGEFLTTQKRFAEAEPLLLYSYESLKKSQSANSPRTKTALQRLVVLYDNWGKPDAADEYRNKSS